MSNSAAEPNVVILISGRGSNMRAIIEDSRAAGSSYTVGQVVSDQPDAGGLRIASQLGIATRALSPQGFTDRSAYDRELAEAIAILNPQLLVLAGFMRILTAAFVHRFAGRILNIHPSLLPKFTGLHTHRRALAGGESEHGATVHFVTPALDAGPAVIQARVPIVADDDEDSLAARVHSVEHQIFPLAVRWFCSGRLRCEAGAAWLDGERLEAPVQWPIDPSARRITTSRNSPGAGARD